MQHHIKFYRNLAKHGLAIDDLANYTGSFICRGRGEYPKAKFSELSKPN